MNIDDLTIGQAKELATLFDKQTAGDSDSHWQVGEKYFIRTVTHIDVGVLVGVTDKELVLENVSWIADTGRYQQAIQDGTLSEVEPYPEGEKVIIGRGALVDAVIWRHDLPREQK